jgi:hypothetical protein
MMHPTRRQVLGLGAASLSMASFVRGFSVTAQNVPPSPVLSYHPIIDPANFVVHIDNRYMPLVPGTIFTYEGTSDGEPQRNIVTVTSETRLVVGVTCTVVRDQVFAGDDLLEDTYDWFAQDKLGRVWYFGEDSTAYEDGNASKEGSWKSGVDGALPGIVMMADPAPGEPYRQEYSPGVAEDMAQVIEVGGEITVPYGSFTQTITTKEWSPLEPDVVEHKTYAPGIGFVYSIAVAGEDEAFSLVDLQPGTATPVA